MDLDNGLLNILTVYAPQSGKLKEESVPIGKLYTSGKLEVVTLAMMGCMVVLGM